MFRRILALARWTAVEALRERILYVVLLFAAILVASSCVLTPLAPGAQIKVVVDFGLATLSALGVLVILLSGAGVVKREIERRSLEVLLCRPLTRFEYLTGKWLGLVASLMVLVVAMTVVFVLALRVTGFAWHPAYFVAIGASALELLVVASLALLFSTFTSPTLASLFTLGLFAAGHLSETVVRLSGGDPRVAEVASVVRWLVPALGLFDLRGEVVHAVPVPASQLIGAAAYALLYALTALYAASLIFRKRELR